MGRPKAALSIGGRPILQYIIESLRWPGPTLLVTGPTREHPPGCEFFDREVADPVEGEGPLRGVLTALQHSATELVVVCTVDMPAMRAEHLGWIAGRLLECPQLDGIMIRRRDGDRELVEPFPFACRSAAADAIAAQLASSAPVHSLLDRPRFAAEGAPPGWPPRIWTNLNTPDEYEAFLAETGQRGD